MTATTATRRIADLRPGEMTPEEYRLYRARICAEYDVKALEAQLADTRRRLAKAEAAIAAYESAAAAR